MKTQIVSLLLLIPFAFISCTRTGQSEQGGSSLGVVSVEEAISLLEKEEIVLIDVRTPAEVSSGYIEGSLHWNYHEWDAFITNAKTLDKSKPVMVYCKAGGRSGKTANYLSEQGFESVYDIRGGMNEWLAQNKPVIKD
ncbi:MAG: rhodanese-like domain-containing protein [Flavobacteriales bacterium]|nr:rhodanese-like domain-containing protein [Flavobacteriales bacterium]